MLQLNNCATTSSRIGISVIRTTAKQISRRSDAVASAVSAEISGEHTRLRTGFGSSPKRTFVKHRYHVARPNNVSEWARSPGADIELSRSSAIMGQDTCMSTTRRNDFLADWIFNQCAESKAGCRAES